MKQVWKTFGRFSMSITVASLAFMTSLQVNAINASTVAISGAAGATSVSSSEEDKQKDIEWGAKKEQRDKLLTDSKIAKARVINDTLVTLSDNSPCSPNVNTPNIFINMTDSVPIPCKPKPEIGELPEPDTKTP